MQFNSVKRQNFSGLAKSTNRTMDQVFAAGRASAVDHTKIAKESIKGRGLERRAAMKAEADVAIAGLNAKADLKIKKMKGETEKAVANIKKPAQRMAGVVAGLGALSSAAIMNKNLKEDKAEREQFKLDQQAVWDRQAEMNAGIKAEREALEERLEELTKSITESRPTPPKVDASGNSTEPTEPAGAATATSSSSSSNSTSQPATSVQPTSVKGFRADVYNYLTQQHKLSKNKALGLMANIDRESSFQINPAGGDGGNSFGMFQWNNTYGRSQLMKENVKDWQTDWKGQIDHALGGNQLPEYNKVTADFKNTSFNSPQEAADYWMKHWERPAHQTRDSKRHTEILSGYNF